MSDREVRERRRRFRPVFGWLPLAALVAVLAMVVVFALSGRPLSAPRWVIERAEAALDAGMEGQGSVHIAGLELMLGPQLRPGIRLRDMTVADQAGQIRARMPEVNVSLASDAFLRLEFRPETLRLSGVRMNLRRLEDGSLDMNIGGDGQGFAAVGSIPELLSAIDRGFRQPLLSGITSVQAEALTLRLDDALSGRVWELTDGRLTLKQTADEVALDLGFGLGAAGNEPARAAVTFVSRKGSPAARLYGRVEGVPADDIAVQAPALAWLGVLDAPISGEFRMEVSQEGRLLPMEGRLEIGAGAVRPAEGTPPVAFNRAAMHFTYDAAAARFAFSEISAEGPSLRFHASGQAFLQEMTGLVPGAVVVQMRFSNVMVDPEGLFEAPVKFSEGMIDARLRLDPFSLSIGQLTLVEGQEKLHITGEIRGEDTGWHAALDVGLNQIGHERLLTLWPRRVVPKTREWLSENVQTGQLFNVKAALRVAPGQEPHLSLGYEFRDADVRFIKTLPPITGAAGHATIEDLTHTMLVSRGHVSAPLGGAVDVSGTVFRVPDITVKPAPAVIRLRTESSITAALSLLDEEPFRFMTKAGRPVEVAEGRAQVEAEIRMPLKKGVKLPEIDYDVTARLLDVSSTTIVPGRRLAAGELTLAATAEGMTVSGPGTLSDIPFRGSWSQGFAPEDRGKSRVEGTVELSARAADAFAPGLPEGTVSGSGWGQITVDLVKGEPPRFRLASDLAGVGLSLPQAGWSLAKETTGKFELRGTLGKPVAIEGLTLEGGGLSATGSVALTPEGGLEVANFDRVRIGEWLDSPVQIQGRGKGAPVGLSLNGGRVDLRGLPGRAGGTGGGAAGGGAAGKGGPIRVALERLNVSESVYLSAVRGEFTQAGGFSGTFSGKLKGEVPVTGTVAPSPNGSAIRIRAEDAGAAFRAIGMFGWGRGGALELVLMPRGPAGDYDGRLDVTDIRVKDAPVLADMLSAISVVGLLEQLSGEGFQFSEVEADFRLTPAAVEIRNAAAVGPSLGVSMEGVYGFQDKRMDLQGVISPIYIVNAIGSVLTRRGEGLFGFNYDITGTAGAPRVRVNPLSLLTPGMFREIFRRPPPTLAE